LKAQREYERIEPFVGLDDGSDVVDVTAFGSPPIKFRPVGDPKTDQFVMAPGTWEYLGKPDRIRVTVKPL
jgi:hypothetical protein